MIEFVKLYNRIISVRNIAEVYVYNSPRTALNSADYKVMLKTMQGDTYVVAEFTTANDAHRWIQKFCEKTPVLNMKDIAL